MSEISFKAYESKQKDRLVALLCLGMTEAVRNQALNFDEAGLQLFWPAAWKELNDAGCSKSILSILQAAAELEDAHSLSPDSFDESVDKLQRKIYSFLRKSRFTADEEVERWLRVEHRSSHVKGNSHEQPRVHSLDRMSSWEFEQLIANVLEELGYACTPVSSSSDRGIDFIAVKDGVRYGIQTKQYKKQKVGAEVVHALIVGLERNGLQRGMLITTTSFTDAANQVAKSRGIELWDRAALARKLEEGTSSVRGLV